MSETTATPPEEEISEFNLSERIFDKIEGLGIDEAAKYFGVSKAIMSRWMGGTAQPTVAAAQRVLDEAMKTGGVEIPVPAPVQGRTIPEPAAATEVVKRTTIEGPKKEQDPVKALEKARKFSILCPINRDMSYVVVMSMLGQWKATLPESVQDLLGHLNFETDTNPHVGRNRLATAFLKTQDEWSFWLDSDVIAPTGNPGWFKRRTGNKHADHWFGKAAITRLTSHPGKLFVGGLYATRTADRKIVASPSDTKNESDKMTAEDIRKGPIDKLIQVDWIGFGCTAVHRKVFEDILERVPGVRQPEGKWHEFFTPLSGGNEGEDMAFCKRAAQAGHAPHLDLSIHCGHVGKFCFNP
jgi:hypothetical protein